MQLHPTLFVKPLILFTTAGLFTTAVVPPKPASVKNAAIYKGQLFEYILRYLAWLGILEIFAASAIHAALVSLDGAPTRLVQSLAPRLCPVSSGSLSSLAVLTPRFLLGASLLYAGAAFRLWSYRALGDLFTYEIFVKDKHTIVDTGPYALVRHPSYTGLIALILGTQLVYFGPGAFATECGIEYTRFAAPIWIWRIGAVFTVFSVYRRCGVEDAQLRERFGPAWDAYRERVPYALLPPFI
ncbi:hypothetical protein GY45DRAFT_1329445 [Cubamyces sp. BRFM 1775]|nr:hypothetical protein GY45DRAFT_1329445 [Cubamyces sp. BRFM 1775]